VGKFGSSSAPKPDKRMGEAALLSAQTGQDFLSFMRDQAAVTNEWAEDDRARYQGVFEPLQNRYINDALRGPDYDSVAGDVRRARADVTNAFDLAEKQEQRRLAAMGVNPAAGRSTEATRRSEIAQGLAEAGAANTTRLASRARAEAEADMKLANSINLGSGLAVNPATSMGLSNNATSQGFGGAMRGYGQQANILNNEWRGRMAAWEADQAQNASMWGGIGSIAGLGISLLSTKDAKTDKQPVRGALEAVENMPVEEWSYKPGMGDEGRHIGPYAEDFKAQTGKGDGNTIPLADYMGVTVAAVKELSAKVDELAAQVGAQKPERGVVGAVKQ
jgi:hypothetical protein